MEAGSSPGDEAPAMMLATISAKTVRKEAVTAPNQTLEPRRLGLRAAINAKCKECIYDPISGFGTWRQQVEACTSPKCPLYRVRPTSNTSGVAPGAEGSSTCDEGPAPGEGGHAGREGSSPPGEDESRAAR